MRLPVRYTPIPAAGQATDLAHQSGMPPYPLHLFTGDGLGEHLVQGLEQAGMLGPGEAFHVNVLKLPHHGSARNVSREFFWRVTANQVAANC
jgi:hypothetical protein